MRHLVLLAALFTAGCAAKPSPKSCPLPPAAHAQEETLASRKSVCQDLADHMVDLGTQVYMKENKILPGTAEAKEVRPALLASLRSRGVLARFAYNCVLQMELPVIQCELKAPNFEVLQACEPSDEEEPVPPPSKKATPTSVAQSL